MKPQERFGLLMSSGLILLNRPSAKQVAEAKEKYGKDYVIVVTNYCIRLIKTPV